MRGTGAPQKAIPASAQSLDLIRPISAFRKNTPDLADAEIQAAIEVHYDIITPDFAVQFFASHQVAGSLHEEQEHTHRLLLESEQPSVSTQFEATTVNREGPEGDGKFAAARRSGHNLPQLAEPSVHPAPRGGSQNRVPRTP